MRKNNLFKIGVNLFGLFAILTVIACFSTVLAGATSVVYAITGAPVIGNPVTVEGVKTASPDLDRDYVSKKITEMRPAATPLDTIMRRIGNQIPINSFRTEYYAVDTRPLSDTVASQYTTNNEVAGNLVVDNISMWAADDTILVKGVTGADGLDLMVFVISKTISTSTLVVQPLNGPLGTAGHADDMILPTIPADTVLVRCGSCKHELDAQTTPYAIIPVKDYNYLQIFMAQVEESTFQKIHEKEVDWNFSDYEAQNIYDMRATMELSYLFGVRQKFSDNTNAKERYTTGGLIRFISKALEYGLGGADRTIDNATFVDWSKEVFTGNSGSDTRILFGGDGLMANLSKVDTVIKQLESKSTEVKWGLTFKSIETNFGRLLFYHHPLFSLAGWGDYGLVLDMNYIEKHTFKPMATRRLSLKESGQRNVDAVVIEETSGLVCRYPDCHAIIAPVA